MRLGELINGTYTKLLPSQFQDFEVRTVSCDSREEQKDGLFVALAGTKFNGEDFIKDGDGKGAKAIVKQKNIAIKNIWGWTKSILSGISKDIPDKCVRHLY